MSLNASDLAKFLILLNVAGVKAYANGNPSQSVNELADTVSAYTFTVSDANNIVEYTNPTQDGSITIPASTSVAIPSGATITLINSSATAARVATIISAAGVTFNWNYPLEIGPGGSIKIQQLSTDFWILKEIYEETTLTWSWGSGLFAAPINATFSVVRNMGNVSLSFPQITSTVGAPGAAGPTLTSSSTLPSRFTPARNVYGSVIVDLSGNTQTVPGRILAIPAGNISFAVNYAASTNFSAGISGVFESSLTYDLI